MVQQPATSARNNSPTRDPPSPSSTMSPPASPARQRGQPLAQALREIDIRPTDPLPCQILIQALMRLGTSRTGQLMRSPQMENILAVFDPLSDNLARWRIAPDPARRQRLEILVNGDVTRLKQGCEAAFGESPQDKQYWENLYDGAAALHHLTVETGGGLLYNRAVFDNYTAFRHRVRGLGFRATPQSRTVNSDPLAVMALQDALPQITLDQFYQLSMARVRRAPEAAEQQVTRVISHHVAFSQSPAF
ncbi:hypothetical protein JCM11641_003989 [Rhodosporidiobolus odoratus]